jgi:WD40 repeat protein
VRLWDVGGLTATADGTTMAARRVTRVIDGHAGDLGPELTDAPTRFTNLAYLVVPGNQAVTMRHAIRWRPNGQLGGLVASATWMLKTVGGLSVPVGRVHLWDGATGFPRAALDAPALALDWTPDGNRLVALSLAGDQRTLRLVVWDVRVGPRGEVEVVAHSRFDVVSKEPLNVFARCQVRFSPDGARLALATPNLAGVWNVANGQRELELPVGVWSVEWRPDGARFLVLTSRPGPGGAFPIEVRDAGSGEVLRTFRPRLGTFTAAAWTLDGRRIVTAASEKRVVVWDPDTGTELLAMPGEAATLSWTRDGRSLLGSGAALQRWEGGKFDAER